MARIAGTPLWELDLDDGRRILRLAVDTHLIASHHLTPLTINKPGSLIVEAADGTTEYNSRKYRISVFYDLGEGRREPTGVLAGTRIPNSEDQRFLVPLDSCTNPAARQLVRDRVAMGHGGGSVEVSHWSTCKPTTQ